MKELDARVKKTHRRPFREHIVQSGAGRGSDSHREENAMGALRESFLVEKGGGSVGKRKGRSCLVEFVKDSGASKMPRARFFLREKRRRR